MRKGLDYFAARCVTISNEPDSKYCKAEHAGQTSPRGRLTSQTWCVVVGEQLSGRPAGR